MNNRAKLLHLLKEEIIYLSIALIFGIMTYLNHDISKSVEMFLYVALFFQLIILITNWKLIFSSDWLKVSKKTKNNLNTYLKRKNTTLFINMDVWKLR